MDFFNRAPEKKFEMLPDVATLNDPRRSHPVQLHQIRALRNIGRSIKAGDLGGFIESESNLSQEGESWVCSDAIVWDNACVSENGWVGGTLERVDAGTDGAALFGAVNIYDNAQVSGNACVVFGGRVKENGRVSDSALIFMTGEVSGHAQVYGNARVTFAGKVKGNALIYGNAHVNDYAIVEGNARVFGGATISGKGTVVSFGAHH